MYTYHVAFYFTSGTIASYSACFDEEQDPNKLANDIVGAKFIHWVDDDKLKIVNLANVTQIVVTGPL